MTNRLRMARSGFEPPTEVCPQGRDSTMARLGFKCDECGEEFRHDPAGFVEEGEKELCSECFDEWWEKNVEGDDGN
jgi:hypothetical protein